MARIRAIKPDVCFDEELCQLPHATRLFFIQSWCHMDRDGRAEDRPAKLRALIFPYEPQIDVEKILADLHPKFIIRYESGGRRYLQVRNWKKHQRPHHTEAVSTIPQPKDGDLTVATPLDSAGVGVGVGVGVGKKLAAKSGGTPRQKSAYQELVECFAANRGIRLDNGAQAGQFFKKHGEAAKKILCMAGDDLARAKDAITAIAAYADRMVLAGKWDPWKNLGAIANHYIEWAQNPDKFGNDKKGPEIDPYDAAGIKRVT